MLEKIQYILFFHLISRCASSEREFLERLCPSENQNQSNYFDNYTLLSENSSLSNITFNKTVANCSLGHLTPIDPSVEFWE